MLERTTRLDESNLETGLFQQYAWLGSLFAFLFFSALSITVTQLLGPEKV